MNDWQSWTALSIVVITGGIFLWRALARKKKPGGTCGGGCGCAPAKLPRR